MIRPFIIFCIFMTALSGLYLYKTKRETLDLNKTILHIIDQTRHVQGQTAMLRTEWALLNQPDRLTILDKKFLPQLHPIEPQQFVRLDMLNHALKTLPKIIKQQQLPAEGNNDPEKLDDKKYINKEKVKKPLYEKNDDIASTDIVDDDLVPENVIKKNKQKQHNLEVDELVPPIPLEDE